MFVSLLKSGYITTNMMMAIAIFASSSILSLSAYIIMRRILRANLVKSLILPRAVELSSALKKLGRCALKEQVTYVSLQGIPLFLSKTPLRYDEQENVRVKIQHMLDDVEYLKKLSGDRRLCLDADDYARLVDEEKRNLVQEKSPLIADAEVEIVALKNELSRAVAELENMRERTTALQVENDALRRECGAAATADEVAALTAERDMLAEENEKLRGENDNLKSKLQTLPGRDKNADNIQVNRAVFWRVGGPLVNELINNAREDRPYTRDEIQAAFERKLNTEFPGLKEEVLALLQAGKQKKDNSFDLRGWAMESIRAGLGEHAKRTGGPNPKV